MEKFNFAKELLNYRTRQNLSQETLSRLLLITVREYNWFETGEKQPTYFETMSLLALLQIQTKGKYCMPWELTPPAPTIAYLKYAVLYNTQSLAEVLKRTVELAEAICCESLQFWAFMEYKGWDPNVAGFPEYRIFPKVYEVNFTKGKDRFDDFPVPYELIAPGDEAGRWSYYTESISGISELFLYQDGFFNDPANHMKERIKPVLARTYGAEIKIIGIAQTKSGKNYRKINLAVLEIIQNFILAIEHRFGTSPTLDVLRLHRDEVDAMFEESLARTGKAQHLVLPVEPRPTDKYHNNQLLIDLLYEVDAEEDHVDDMLDSLSEGEQAEDTGKLEPVTIDFIKKMAKLYPRLGPEGIKLRKAYEGYYGVGLK